jgi:hypothetical protein
MSKSNQHDVKSGANRYQQIVVKIFAAHYKKGTDSFVFERDEILEVAKSLGMQPIKNTGDVIYSVRYRGGMPDSIRSTAPKGKEWSIQPAGRAKYRFHLRPEWNLVPNALLSQIKIPDATPGVIERYAQSDEQALLAKLRYNRLIDIFSGLACYSLQNHLRTQISGIGQIETDELYIGVDRHGAHYVLPVQAKGGSDKLNIVQIEQDLALSAERFPGLICRPIGAQFMDGGVIALFEFESTVQGVTLKSERHYRLVPPEEISSEDLASYRSDYSSGSVQ